MVLLNVSTQAQRNLHRKVSLNGPFLEVKTQKWYLTDPDDSEVETEEAPNSLIGTLTRVYEKAQAENT